MATSAKIKKLTPSFILATVLAAHATGSFAADVAPQAKTEEAQETSSHQGGFMHAIFVNIARNTIRQGGAAGFLDRFDNMLKNKSVSEAKIEKMEARVQGLVTAGTMGVVEQVADPYLRKDGQLNANELLQVALTLGKKSTATLHREDQATRKLLQKSAAILSRYHVQDSEGLLSAYLARFAISFVKDIVHPSSGPAFR